VDALAAVFIDAVAKGRGISQKTVIEKFGSGDVLIGKAAVAAGLADTTGNFEAVVATLAKGETPRPQSFQPMHRRSVRGFARSCNPTPPRIGARALSSWRSARS
jgi:ClpP class serine protease